MVERFLYCRNMLSLIGPLGYEQLDPEAVLTLLFTCSQNQAMTIKLTCRALKLPFTTSFAHASATRTHGESVWVTASEEAVTGVGEGCPRGYVTGETLEGSLRAFAELASKVERVCHDLESMRTFMRAQSAFVDRHPSVWCAVEGALLDLFAQRTGQSVDELLGLGAPTGMVRYSAVLGAESPEKAHPLIELYAAMKMQDYKIKIVHDTACVHAKIAMIMEAHDKEGLPTPRIRLDANNLWTHDTPKAVQVLSEFVGKIIAVEEPLAAHAAVELSTLSEALDLPMILDESVCKAQDLKTFADRPGDWVVNIKISKFGGILRVIEFLEGLGNTRPKVVLGAHVGESSVLTRASHTVRRWLDGNVMAQEGAFGERLLMQDMMTPSVEFGSGGLLDMARYASPGWGVTLRKDMCVEE